MAMFKSAAIGLVLLAFVSFSNEAQSKADSSLLRQRRSNDDTIEISGYISFDKKPKSIPSGSQLTVTFKDSRVADASSVQLGQTTVDVDNYNNNSQLLYNMTAKRPTDHGHYSVDAVLNMGWKQVDGKDEWIRNGDYHTSTAHNLFVNVTTSHRKYTKNITLELYERSKATIAACKYNISTIIIYIISTYST